MTKYHDNMTAEDEATLLEECQRVDDAYIAADLYDRQHPQPDLFAGLGSDAAKWGVSDFYDAHEAVLRKAVESGEAFDTGWYSVKKEIQSGRVWCKDDGDPIYVQASCSDDFDTEATCDPIEVEGDDFDAVVAALDKAIDAADELRKDNAAYEGFSLLRRKRTDSYACQDYLILPRGDGHLYDTPPGDEYGWWGWSSDPDGKGDKPDPEFRLPATVRKKMMEWANECNHDEAHIDIGQWRLERWK